MSVGIDLVVGSVFGLSELIRKLFKISRITIRYSIGGGVKLKFDEEKTIDERIAKIDEARKSMVEVMTAIDDLHEEAEANKSQLQDALIKLSEVEKNKNMMENELKSIRQVMQTDIHTARVIMGIPSQEEIKKERVLGFFTGVLASIVASIVFSGIAWGVASYWPSMSHYTKEKYAEFVLRQETPNKPIQPTPQKPTQKPLLTPQ